MPLAIDISADGEYLEVFVWRNRRNHAMKSGRLIHVDVTGTL
jgi:hypothetical protein